MSQADAPLTAAQLAAAGRPVWATAGKTQMDTSRQGVALVGDQFGELRKMERLAFVLICTSCGCSNCRIRAYSDDGYWDEGYILECTYCDMRAGHLDATIGDTPNSPISAKQEPADQLRMNLQAPPIGARLDTNGHMVADQPLTQERLDKLRGVGMWSIADYSIVDWIEQVLS